MANVENKLDSGRATRSPSSRRRFWRYGPLIFWAALIFIGSTDLLSGSNTNPFLREVLVRVFPHASETTLHVFYLTIRKAGHITEYTILALLAARASITSSRALLHTYWFAASLLFAIAYAASDEFHQSFVPARGASVEDVLIDTLGGLLGLTILWLWLQRKKKREIH